MRQKTLICVLDWGLGHASRSLALAKHALLKGDEVYWASSGQAKAFLERELPTVRVYDLPAYDVRYPTGSMPLNVAMQFPRWWLTARREQRVVAQLVEQLGITRLITDNRFGCYAPGVDCIFLTHQLHPITGSRPVSWLYQKYLLRFDAYWVPDTAGRHLSGKLSDARGYEKVQYIGPLSRLSPPANTTAKTIDYLAILSGPEPMRTRLEKQLIALLPQIPGKHVIVRGVPNAQADLALENPELVNFADTGTLMKLIPAARNIICRAGYSTLLDLAAINADANMIFIPTPGQTEQVYLAKRLAKKSAKNRFIRQRDVHQLLGEADIQNPTSVKG